MNKFNIYEFIKRTKQYDKRYISYCEAIIDPFGNIIEVMPSHTETAIAYAMEKENKSKEEIKRGIPKLCLPLEWCIDKYGLVAIWYSGYMYGTYKRKKPNRFQRRSLDILIKNGLILEVYKNSISEYGNYLYRKSLGIEE